MTGAIIRHGPHHAAQKSTRNEPLRIDAAKLSSVRSIGWPPVSGVLHLPQTAFLAGSDGNRLACPQLGQRTTSFIAGGYCEMWAGQTRRTGTPASSPAGPAASR